LESRNIFDAFNQNAVGFPHGHVQSATRFPTSQSHLGRVPQRRNISSNIAGVEDGGKRKVKKAKSQCGRFFFCTTHFQFTMQSTTVPRKGDEQVILFVVLFVIFRVFTFIAQDNTSTKEDQI